MFSFVSIFFNEVTALEKFNFQLQRFSEISNSKSATLVSGTSEDDNIYNSASNVTINSGAGNDTVSVSSSSYYSGPGECLIYGDNGNDQIYFERVNTYSSLDDSTTVNGGKGNDTIISAYGIEMFLNGTTVQPHYVSNIYQYSSGDGNDFIQGANSTDTLQISGANYSTQVSGDNLIVNVENEKITLEGLAETQLNIQGTYDISALQRDNPDVEIVSAESGRDKIFYSGDSKKIVTNFSEGAQNDSDVVVITGGNFFGVSRENHDISITMADGNYIKLKTNSSSGDETILYSADGENIFGAKIADGNSTILTYSADTNFYQFNDDGGTLKVSNNAEIWLDGSHGNTFINVKNIDASSASEKNILVGDSSANSIKAGLHGDSLWGGVGNISDTLVGGYSVGNDCRTYLGGSETFFYGKNDGDDFIRNTSPEDTINLYDITLNDIVSAEIAAYSITINFVTGSALYVDQPFHSSNSGYIYSYQWDTPSNGTIFQLADGSKWQYNNSNSEWQSA